MKIPDGPKMARSALSRRVIEGPYSGQAGRRLFAIWRLRGPDMARTEPL